MAKNDKTEVKKKVTETPAGKTTETTKTTGKAEAKPAPKKTVKKTTVTEEDDD